MVVYYYGPPEIYKGRNEGNDRACAAVFREPRRSIARIAIVEEN
jgi:hypothetical protein